LPSHSGEAGFLVSLNISDGAASILKADPDFYYSRIIKTNGVYYISASFRGDTLIGGKTFSSPSVFTGLFFRADETLTPLWASHTKGGLISSFDVDANGSILAGGAHYEEVKIDNAYTFNKKGESDFFLVKYKSDGSISWAIQPSGPNIDVLNDIQVDKQDNSFYIIAAVQSGPVKLGNLTVQGNFSGSPFLAKETTNATGLNDPEKEAFSFNIYPNPASATLYVNTQESEGIIRIISITGQVLKTIRVQQGINQLDISGLSRGLYTITVTTATGTSSKLVEIMK
jgi:hypothetical protein